MAKPQKIKKTVKKTVVTTVVTEYKIHPNVTIEEIVVNDKPQLRKIVYSGKVIKDKHGCKHHYFGLYDPDLKVLKKTNPWWQYGVHEKWFLGSPIPENPEDIDLDKIVFACSYDHSFHTHEMEIIPTVVQGDYLAGLRSSNYDLDALHEHLSKHEQVVSITDIDYIPYYNNDDGDERYFEVFVLPTLEQWKILKDREDIFYRPWLETPDYLGMSKFYIGKK